MALREVSRGVFHWSAPHEPIGVQVSSHFVEPAGIVIDPKVPDEGLEALPGRPQQVVLTSGHHARDAQRFAHIAVGEGAIAFADGLNRYGEALAFFPDNLLGDDPRAVKRGLKQAFQGLLTRDFDHLLFAHGDPLIGGGRAALRDFVASPVGEEDFGQSP